MTNYPYLPNSSDSTKRKMLDFLKITSIEELYNDVPNEILFKRKLNLPNSISENEVLRVIKEKLEKNFSLDYSKIFVGGGVWPHLIPSIVNYIISRGEFLTAYTP